MIDQDPWNRHLSGPNPAPDRLVDVQWGFGLIESIPSSQLNWGCRWLWRLSAGQQAEAQPMALLGATKGRYMPNPSIQEQDANG